MAINLANFPNTLARDSDISLTRDPRRLLLSLKQSHTRQEIDERLKNTGLILEDSNEEASMVTRVLRYFHTLLRGEISYQWERVQHTPRKFWVRSQNGKPIIQENITALERSIGPTLNWAGPVYGSPESVGRKGLFCPFPNVLIVKPVANVKGKALLTKLDELNLREIPEKSQYGGGYRYFISKDPTQYTVYPLQTNLVRRIPGLIQEAHLERMFMLSSAANAPNDRLYGLQWNMTKISAHLAWDTWKGSNSVVVCVLDTGCDLDHPDLMGRYTKAHTVLDDSGSYSGRPGDLISLCDSHGTRCAGVVAAGFDNSIGVAGLAGSYCQIMPVAFPFESAWTIAEGIRYAADNGAQVISLSYADDGWKDPYLDGAIEYACQPDPVHNRPGVLICVCTQNYGANHIQYPATLNDPNHAWVMACGASDPSDIRCTFSDYGDEMSVVAPGVGIPTTTNRQSLMPDWRGCNDGRAMGDLDGDGSGQLDYYSQFAGTSAATPHVGGLAALLISSYPYLTNIEVRGIIERTADYIPSAVFPTLIKPNGNWNEETGYGRINVFRALQSQTADVIIKDYPGDTGVEPSSPPNGDFWTHSDIVVRPQDDDVFVPDDPMQSSVVIRGQINYLYVRITNNGPSDARNVEVSARITPWVGLEFVYPTDWTTTDGNHVAPMPVSATLSTVPAGSAVIAKFTISPLQVEDLWGWVDGMNWHPCVLAEVTADNDYALNSPALTGSSPAVLRNNLAQRNLSVTGVLAGASVMFPFFVGHRQNADQILEVLIERGLIPEDFPPVLSLDPPGPLPMPMESSDQPPIGAVSVEGGRIIRRADRRLVEITGTRTAIRMEKAPRQVYALALQTMIPRNAERGQQYTLKVSQRNREGETVGGATVIYVVTGQSDS